MTFQVVECAGLWDSLIKGMVYLGVRLHVSFPVCLIPCISRTDREMKWLGGGALFLAMKREGPGLNLDETPQPPCFPWWFEAQATAGLGSRCDLGDSIFFEPPGVVILFEGLGAGFPI